MATGSKVYLDTTERPAFAVQLQKDAAEKTNQLLQENHEKHHIFFNQSGFHNHIAHHLLTLYALGASPDFIQKGYDHNKDYQRPPVDVQDSVVRDMHDPQKFKQYLGDEKYYHDYLLFFQDEIDKKGWGNVLNEYVFQGDDRADDMLVRMFAGFLHPIIHLGFGVEFSQPAIIAEALAQAAVHDTWMGPLLLGAEKLAKENKVQESKTLVELLDAIHEDEKVAKAPRWEDGNKLRDGIIKRVPEEMSRIASQYVVKEDELELKTAEMINAAVYYTGAAQKPPKLVKFDFFFMHCVNCSIFFPSFLSQPWLSTENKVRLLEWKGRNDLAMYASRAAPTLLLSEIEKYQPKAPTAGNGSQEEQWAPIFDRVFSYADDGHAAKLLRALANGRDKCGKWEDREEFRIKGDHWLQLAHMTIDSVEVGDPVWVRSCGFPEAWENVGQRPLPVL